MSSKLLAFTTKKHSQNAVVFGGSSGLGLAICRRLALDGYHVTIVGRDAQRLTNAVELIDEIGSQRNSFISFHVGEAPRDTLKQTLESQVDSTALVVNAIGRSDRGYLLQLTDDQCCELFRSNVITALHAAFATQRLLAASGGCLVNIGSLASLFATPGVGGYALTKFSLAAVTQQLRLELASSGIHCMLACPGPIKDDRQQSRYAEIAATRELPPDLIKPGAGVKISRLDPDALAEQILAAAAKRKRLLIRPRKAYWLYAINACSPRLGELLLRKFAKS